VQLIGLDPSPPPPAPDDPFDRGGFLCHQELSGSDYRNNLGCYLTAPVAYASIDRRAHMRRSNIVPALRCCPGSRAMPANKMAAVSLMALILLCSPTTGRRQPECLSQAEHGAARVRVDSSVALIPLAHLSRSSSVAPFAPWRNRLKSVLEETSQKVVDQLDVGPVVVPAERSRSASIEMIGKRLSTAPPMRC
jgi:hypothetical protein